MRGIPNDPRVMELLMAAYLGTITIKEAFLELRARGFHIFRRKDGELYMRKVI